MALEKDFWKNKPLTDFTDEEWEAVCDNCGICCFRKYLEGHRKNTKLYYTRIACDNLDLDTGLCTCYQSRFKQNQECTHLTKNNVDEFNWLPDTCAYRLLASNRPLPHWHPLVCGSTMMMKSAGIQIKDGIHEKDAEYWEDYVTKVESI